MLTRLTEQDYYQILEVDYSASSEEIQAAYETARDIYSGESMVSLYLRKPVTSSSQNPAAAQFSTA